MTSVLVLGPTGGFGKYLIAELVRRKSEFKRIGAFNDTERPPSEEKLKIFEEYTDQGVEVVSGTFDDVEPFRGFTHLLLPLGNHALSRQPAAIASALRAGVTHVYPSEFGADLLVPGNWDERYYRDKVRTREYLQRRHAAEAAEAAAAAGDDAPAAAAAAEGLRATYFVNGRFTEWAVIPHFGVFPGEGRARIVGRGDMRQSLLSVVDAAKYLIHTILDPLPPSDGGFERTYRFVGGNYTWTEIFETLEKVQGVKYDVVYTDVAEARAAQKKAIETGDVDAELQASHQVIQGTGRTVVPEPYDNYRFPDVKPETLEQTFTRMFSHPEDFPLLEL